MDKYGVVLDEEMYKTATQGSVSCPLCGTRQVDTAGSVPNCPNCGTKPWEKEASWQDQRRRRKKNSP